MRASAWFYILAYASLRAIYVLIFMPLAGGTFGSIVGWMICTFLLLVSAIVALHRRPPLGFALLFLYLIAVSIVWCAFEIPTMSDYLHDRVLDLLLIPAFYGASGSKRLAR